MSANIKIYVSCHKESYVSNNPLIHQIQVGAAMAKNHFENMLHDDEGENISEKNKSYSELTAQYWVWKHEDADYYGFFHYRRYFSFTNDALPTDPQESIIFDYIDDETERKICLNEPIMRFVIEKEDVIVSVPYNIKHMGYKNVREQYATADSHYVEDLDLAIDIIREKYPDMAESAEKYMASGLSYICNMFIMKKEVFHKYSEWLFDVLEEVERRSDFTNYSDYAYRLLGFLGERLLGVFVTYLKDEGKYRVRELQRTLFANTDRDENIKPAFGENNIPIVLIASNGYAPLTGVMVRSICRNVSSQWNYDILVIEKELTDANKDKIREAAAGLMNVSVRFCNAKRYIYVNFSESQRYLVTEATFRLFLYDFLPNYEKLIYLDSDTIVIDDLRLLFSTTLGDCLVGACRDIDVIGSYNTKGSPYIEYLDQTLKLDLPYDYIQSGVLLINLAQFRKNFSIMEILEHLKNKDFKHPCKDTLNILTEGRKIIFDMRWNYIVNDDTTNRDIFRKDVFWNLPRGLSAEYKAAKENLGIVHYAGGFKPWQNPSCEMSNLFWETARQLSYYEFLIFRMTENLIGWSDGSPAPASAQDNEWNIWTKIARKILPESWVMAIWRFKCKLFAPSKKVIVGSEENYGGTDRRCATESDVLFRC